MSYSWALAKWKGILKLIRKKQLPVANPELLSDEVAKTVKRATKKYNRAKSKKITEEELADYEEE